MLVKREAFVRMYKALILAFAIYLLIAFIRFPDILLNITKMVPGAAADTYGNLWDIWWVPYALFKLHASIFSTNLLFWPIGANLVYQTMTPAAALLTAPLQAISLPLAYNVLFFLGFALSGAGMFVLADYVTSNKYAAFISGLIYTFSATHIIQSYIYLDWMFWCWIPIGLYFFIRILKEERNYYNAFGLAVSFLLSIAMGNLEEGIIEIMLYVFVLAAYLIYHATRKGVLRKWVALQLLVAVLLVLIMGAWLVVPLVNLLLAKPSSNLLNQNLLSVANQLNSLQYNVQNSMDLLSFFLPSFYNGPGTHGVYWYYRGLFAIASIEKTGYLTYTAIILALIGIIKTRDRAVLWAALGLIFAWISMGPYLQVAGASTQIPGLYLLYSSIKYINVVREPGRFIIIAIMALAILAGYGFIEISKFLEKRAPRFKIGKTYMLIAAISILFLFENTGMPITNSLRVMPFTTVPTIPRFYYELKSIPDNFSVLQLPAIPSTYGQSVLYEAEAEFYSTASLKPLDGGYITRTNYTEFEYLYYLPLAIEAKNLQDFGFPYYLSPVNENYSNQTLLFLYNFKTAFVVINTGAFNSTQLSYLYTYSENLFGSPVYIDNSTIAFQTSNAIQRALYKSFVVYPVLSDWNLTTTEKNGSAIGAWSPVGDGLLAIYAPYPKGIDEYNSIPSQTYTTNATMRFVAYSASGRQSLLYIEEQAGSESPVAISSIEVAPYEEEYEVRLPDLVSGPDGNYALFVVSNSSQSQVRVYNITISKS
jgi:hypothetical protein